MALFLGTARNDVLTGTGEDDYFLGFAGEDEMTGRQGDDTFVVNVYDAGVDTIRDFEVGDELRVIVIEPEGTVSAQAIQEYSLTVETDGEVTRMTILPAATHLTPPATVELEGQFSQDFFRFQNNVLTLLPPGERPPEVVLPVEPDGSIGDGTFGDLLVDTGQELLV